MVELKNLTKIYGQNVAVDNVSFSVGTGTVLGFLGANGAGKSTTMNMITGYLSATKGTIEVGGYDMLEEPIQAKACIGFLPDHPPLYPNMTTEDYLKFVFDLKRTNLPREKHIAEVCDLVKIAEVSKKLIGNLSKGYRQRVGVAQALLGYPPVLILDEPTVGIDPMQMVDIRTLIKELGNNHTVIFSSHILSEVQAVSDRVLIIASGRIVADDTPESLSKVFGERRGQTVCIDGPPGGIIEALSNIPGINRVVLIESDAKKNEPREFLLDIAMGFDWQRAIFFCLAERGWPLMFPHSEVSLEDVFLQLVDTDTADAPFYNESSIENDTLQKEGD